MRDGNGVIFYWPVVLNPDGVMRPLPSGEIVNIEAISGFEDKLVLAADRDNEMYNRTGKDGGFSNIVLDPRAIPVAMEKPHFDGVQYERENVNRLEVKHFQGLFVGSYFDSNNRPLYNGPSSLHEETGAFKELENLVVTVKDITKNFLDCDNQPIVHPDNFSGFGNIKLATCANLNGLVDRITQMVMDIISQQLDSIRQEFDSKFDGSNATKDVIPGAQDVPYTPPDNYTTIPYTYRNAIVRKEAHEYESTPVLINDSQLQVGTVYAIDMYGTIGQDEKTYKGTLYKVATSTHRVPGKHVSLSERKSETSSHFSYDVQTQHYVLRTLKPGENAVVTP